MFNRICRWTSEQTGKTPALVIAFGTVLIWAILGPIFHYSEAWQLVINTSTTIVTFLMVFLLQRSQNEDTDEIKRELRKLTRKIEDI